MDDDMIETFDRYMTAAITGVSASESRPLVVADLASQIATEAIKKRAEALQSISQQMNRASTVAEIVHPTVTVPAAKTRAIPSKTVTARGAGTPQDLANSPESQADANRARMKKLGLIGDTCPLCNGTKKGPSLNENVQCKFIHYPPHGEAVAPPQEVAAELA